MAEAARCKRPPRKQRYHSRMKCRLFLRIRFHRAALLLLALLVLGYLALVLLLQPSNDRDWTPDQERVATAVISGDAVLVRNLRNARYRSIDDYDVRWEDRRYDLRRLESAWFLVEPFADWRGPAHTFLSFGFGAGEYLAVSVEIRKEKGESFSPLAGLLRQYELVYVLGDERDLIQLRSNHRRDDVYLYRIRATPEKIRALLVSMLERANQVALQPEFYDTLSNTCTSNIVDHVEVIAPGRIPFSYRTLLPGYSDDLAYDLGLVDTALPRDQYRAAHRINELALRHADRPDFSEAIRKGARRD